MTTHPYEDQAPTDNFAYIIEQRKVQATSRIADRDRTLRDFDQAFAKFATMIACLGVVLLVCGLGGCLAIIFTGR